MKRNTNFTMIKNKDLKSNVKKELDMAKVTKGTLMMKENNDLVTKKNGRCFCNKKFSEEVKKNVYFKNHRAEESKEDDEMSEDFYAEMNGFDMKKINLGYEMLSQNKDLIKYDEKKYSCSFDASDCIKELVRYENEYMNRLYSMKKKIKERIGNQSLEHNIDDVFDGLDFLERKPNSMKFDGVSYYCENNSPKCIKELVKYENHSLLVTIELGLAAQKIRLYQTDNNGKDY